MHLFDINIAINIIYIFVFLIAAYYTAAAAFSFVPRSNVAKEIKKPRFAVIIPAHNEERVLKGLLDSIKNADYESELIQIIVVADGCSDRTAYIARRFGATVIEKQLASCKGEALKAAFDYLKGTEYDCIAVFDADNLADEGFFREISERLSLGAVAVQGYIDSKNPYESWVSCAHSVWYWITNRLIQSGRAKLGLGCRIGGTGFVVSREVIERVPWHTVTVAEDAEYTCLLADNGIKVDYAERAVVYDEKPISFSQSAGQRRRWSRGICDVQGEYTLRLLFKGHINAVMGLWSDVLYPLSVAVLVCFAFVRNGIWASPIGYASLLLCIAVNVLAVPMALIIDKKISRNVMLNLFGMVLYLVSWIPIGFFGIFGRDGEWYHTKHREQVK